MLIDMVAFAEKSGGERLNNLSSKEKFIYRAVPTREKLSVFDNKNTN